MTTYLSFVAFATLLAVAPGPDTFLTLRATVVSGRRRGLLTVCGITCAGAIQGLLAATGLGAVLAHTENVFMAIRWAGVLYLSWLGYHAIREALKRNSSAWSVGTGQTKVNDRAAFRQGFVCNITNPKVLAFNVAVLPQFISDGQGLPVLIAYALTLVIAGTLTLLVLIQLSAMAAGRFARPRFRRSVDGLTGTVMIGFAIALAAEG